MDSENEYSFHESIDPSKEEDPPPKDVAKSSASPAHLAEIDQYISSLGGDATPPDVPIAIEQFLGLVEERMDDRLVKWNHLREEDAAWFLEAVDRVSSLSKSFSRFSPESESGRSLNRAGKVLQRAMTYLEEELKLLLEENKTPNDEMVKELMRISKAMIVGGYESECCHVYIVVRRDALEEKVMEMELDKHSIDDVHKKPWESLERDIELWILKFTDFAKSHLWSERKLSDSVFSEHPWVSDQLFRCLSRDVTKPILKFAEAIALTRRSPDKLFKYLTVYEAIRDVISGIGSQLPQGGVAPDLKNEAWMIRSHLAEAMISILNELENSIKKDHGKNHVPGGAVHPITTYIMNYLEYTAMYNQTLEQVYLEHRMIDVSESDSQDESAPTPFQAQILKIMDLLDSNIAAKSKFYKDPSLSSIFMMNNGRYMLKKIKKSNQLHNLLGETWYRKMSSELRQYHKEYQRETWGKLLGFLSPEGLTGSKKEVKRTLKDRFKSFNSMFDEIRKTQTNWVISDEQLQSELRVSISNMVVPAYRSFLSRYASQIFTKKRQTEKYIKHQPDDVEAAIEVLFSGTPTSRKL